MSSIKGYQARAEGGPREWHSVYISNEDYAKVSLLAKNRGISKAFMLRQLMGDAFLKFEPELRKL